MNNDLYMHPSLNSGEGGRTRSQSALCHSDSVLRMKETASNMLNAEGLCIFHNVVNELGELNDSRLIEGEHPRLRDAQSIIERSNQVNRRHAQSVDAIDANHQRKVAASCRTERKAKYAMAETWNG